MHKDILEGGKGHDMKSLLGLGETLKIGQDIFENIDKVWLRFLYMILPFSYVVTCFFVCVQTYQFITLKTSVLGMYVFVYVL